MEHPHEPVNVIQDWQEWYKKNRVIAQMDEPLVSKDSRENLHDSSNAVDTLPDWRTFYAELIDEPQTQVTVPSNKQKAIDYFADTLAVFNGILTGSELFECFLTAAVDSLNVVQKEYEQAKDLVDLLRCKNHLNKSSED
jgi:hypothetical protein